MHLIFPVASGRSLRARRVFDCSRRRRGVAAVYVGALMIFLLMVASMVIDMGFLYRKQEQAQRAADAAALAGVYQLAHFAGQPNADAQARYYAGLSNNGGYVDGMNGASVTVQYPAADEQGVVHANWYRVTVSRPERTFFALASSSKAKYTVSATATGMYETNAPITINGLGTYGATNTSVNICAFGPDARYDYGDCYSTKYLLNGQPNPNYDPTGFDFLATVPQHIKNPQFDVMDPDCYDDQGMDSANLGNGKIEYDQYRAPDGSTTDTYNGVSTLDVTRYSVYDDNGTPGDPTDDVLLGSVTYGGTSAADKAANGNWVPFWIDTRSSRSNPNSNYRINVQTLSGSSNNGYNLRCGPQLNPSQPFNPNNGTSISADGHICLNFFQDGTVDVTLGSIPTQAAGGTLTINKFDTDVGATNITYTCSSLPGSVFPGTLAANGQFAADVLTLPTTYTTGTWIAHYTAGHSDTSCWSMSYSNAGPGSPGRIRLVR